MRAPNASVSACSMLGLEFSAAGARSGGGGDGVKTAGGGVGGSVARSSVARASAGGNKVGAEIGIPCAKAA